MKPVLEEYIPLKSKSMNIIHGDHDQKSVPSTASSEKSSWMVSAQLWSPAGDETKQQPVLSETPKDTEVSTKLVLDNTKQRNGGAFIPFTKENKIIKGSGPISTIATSSQVLPDLALASSSPNKEMENKNFSEVVENGISKREISTGSAAEHAGKGSTDGQPSGTTTTTTSSQTHRKARRCWSPDLHRRFVNALQILGGSQVATPKQIRELMKVDGLTNDEVKSHLQKYRLHTRRPMQAAQPSNAASAPQLVVLGGIWVPPEYATSAAAAAAAAAAAPAIYGAHPVSTHYCAQPVPQEFYSPAAAHHHHHHPQVQPLPPRNIASSYKGRLESSESDMRSGGERSESFEEEEEGEEIREDEEEEEEDADVEEADDKPPSENALVLVSHEGSGLKL
ncbi:hypothetical protein J5N97_000145 [Dioscorea zingiberensis]|uniref:HTH myb-type domain-containing protein n=1 Tax=Dioscorea zingiberensis TaxID=325984 RepID=A0A9D5BSZ7_9LILI|nr:hypothetical protein J5N97_000145 [Dioscorea zingiberensis]